MSQAVKVSKNNGKFQKGQKRPENAGRKRVLLTSALQRLLNA